MEEKVERLESYLHDHSRPPECPNCGGKGFLVVLEFSHLGAGGAKRVQKTCSICNGKGYVRHPIVVKVDKDEP